jgi:hypothetical protein
VKLFLLLSLVSASVSFTVSETYVFKWLRDATWGPLNKLLSCGYCLGFWVALALMFIYEPRIVDCEIDWVDFCATWLAMAWLSGAQWIVMCLLFTKAGK